MADLDELIDESSTLRDALMAIERSTSKIALIVDKDRVLKGTLTDGDIRRALLHGADLDTPVGRFMNTSPVVAHGDESHEQLLAHMLKTRRAQLPIVDDAGRIVAVVAERQLMRTTPRHDNLVFILAGGLGTRLKPLTEAVPKPMLEIGGRPILEHIVERFTGQGFHRFCFAVCYKSDLIVEYFGNGKKWGVEIQYLHEQSPLGTAGALGQLETPETLPLIVMNGDIVTRLNFAHLLDFHREIGSEATICARPYAVPIPFGVLDLDGAQVCAMREKPDVEVMVNAGIYCIGWRTVEVLKTGLGGDVEGTAAVDMPELLTRAKREGLAVNAYPLHEYWIDIGRMDELDRARLDFSDA